MLWGHARLVELPRPDSPWLIGPSGTIGVDLFFVVSGFVMSMLHDTAATTASGFLRARLCRVLPLYLLLSAALLVAVPATGVQLWNSILFVPVFDRVLYTNPVHWFGWTIGLELWFYLAFALAIALGRRAKSSVAAGLGLGVFACWADPAPSVWMKYLFNPMALEFVAGILAWRLVPYVSRSLARWLALSGSAIGAAAALALPDLGHHRVILQDVEIALMRVVLWGLPMFAVVLGAVALERTGSRSVPRWIIRLGDASYSLYLLQPLVLLAIRRLGLADWRVAAIGFVVVTPMLALVSRRCLEGPLTERLRRVSVAPARIERERELDQRAHARHEPALVDHEAR